MPSVCPSVRLSVLFLGALGCAGTGSTNSTDGVPPSIVITAPVEEATVSGQVSIDANVTDGDSGVDKVRFLVDGVELAVQFTPPFHAVWDTHGLASGTRVTLRVEATDVAKNFSSVQIHVTVMTGPNAR